MVEKNATVFILPLTTCLIHKPMVSFSSPPVPLQITPQDEYLVRPHNVFVLTELAVLPANELCRAQL